MLNFPPIYCDIAKRRNQWICALKSSLSQVRMFGPSGNPDAKSGPTQYTLVPYEEVKQNPFVSSPIAEPQGLPGGLREQIIPPTYNFTDQSSSGCEFQISLSCLVCVVSFVLNISYLSFVDIDSEDVFGYPSEVCKIVVV